MKRIILGFFLFLAGCSPALSQLATTTTGNEFATQQSVNGAPNKTVVGVVNMCIVAGIATPCSSSSGATTVNQGTPGATPWPVSVSNLNANGQTTSALSAPVVPASDWVGNFQGNIAAGATETGNPLLVGCDNITTLPTLANNQRGALQCDTRNGLYVVLKGDGSANAKVGASTAGTTNLGTNPIGINAVGFPFNFNGTNYETQNICPNTAVINVTAGATTQLVALSGTTAIRVCSFSVSMSAAGTAQFLYGTGANCATSPTNLTGAVPLATQTPWSLAVPFGSLFKGAAGNALCLAATVGNAIGYATYAQY